MIGISRLLQQLAPSALHYDEINFIELFVTAESLSLSLSLLLISLKRLSTKVQSPGTWEIKLISG